MVLLTVVFKVTPVAMTVPPLAAVYQLTVPLQPLAVNDTAPAPHLVVELTVGATGISLTVAVAEPLLHSQPFSVQLA